MSTLSKPLSAASSGGQLRAFDARRDLLRVADLVEQCFTETLDIEGRGYLRQMRAAASNTVYLRWIGRLGDSSAFPTGGFVWEEDRQLVGNLTLIPFTARQNRYYLIANVAVHPDYRRRGIARRLTSAAVEQARRRGAYSAWLHVRAENQAAIQLYQTLGFLERARRTTWQSNGSPAAGAGDLQGQAVGEALDETGILIAQRRAADWAYQQAWLAQVYPPEITWHLPLDISLLRPGVRGFLARLFNDALVRQWSARHQERLLGVLTWQSTRAYADSLWLAAEADVSEAAIAALLRQARQTLPFQRTFNLDYPAGRARRAFLAAGFREHQTLIWMEHKLDGV